MFCSFDGGTCYIDCDRICLNIPKYEYEIASSLACIKPNKAPGPVGLKDRVLKHCAFHLTGVFTQLIQLLLNNKVVPSSRKLLNIVPVWKISNATQ